MFCHSLGVLRDFCGRAVGRKRRAETLDATEVISNMQTLQTANQWPISFKLSSISSILESPCTWPHYLSLLGMDPVPTEHQFRSRYS